MYRGTTINEAKTGYRKPTTQERRKNTREGQANHEQKNQNGKRGKAPKTQQDERKQQGRGKR
jgi:hypothetical protein